MKPIHEKIEDAARMMYTHHCLHNLAVKRTWESLHDDRKCDWLSAAQDVLEAAMEEDAQVICGNVEGAIEGRTYGLIRLEDES